MKHRYYAKRVLALVLVTSMTIGLSPKMGSHNNEVYAATHTHTDACYRGAKHVHNNSCYTEEEDEEWVECGSCGGSGSTTERQRQEEYVPCDGSCPYCSGEEGYKYCTGGVTNYWWEDVEVECGSCGGSGGDYETTTSSKLICTKSTTNYYYNNAVDSPICSQVVTKLVPTSASQTINAGATPVSTATATFLDGTTQVVNCSLIGYNSLLYNTEQTVTLSYGQYSSTAKNAVACTTTAKITVNGVFTITFDSANGSSVSSKQVAYGSAYGTLSTPTRLGCTFLGWKDESGNIVSSTTVYQYLKNTTLTAQWSVNNYSVSLLNVGTSSSGANLSQAFGSNVIIDAGTKTNQFFLGWEASGITLANPASKNTSFTMPANNVTLSAKWGNIIGITATLNSNFTSRFNGFKRDDMYDVDKNIVITRDMIDVVVNITDENNNYISKSTSNFTFTGGYITNVGENIVKVTSNDYGFTYEIRIKGYSSSLDDIMNQVGVDKDDYESLALRISEILEELNYLNSQIGYYSVAISDIQNKLNEGGITVEESADLAENLQRTLDAVNDSISKIKEYENDIYQIRQKVNNILELCGEEGTDSLNIVLLLNDIDNIEQYIANSNDELTTLKNNIYDINSLLNIDSESDMTDIYSELSKAVLIVESIKIDLGIVTSGSALVTSGSALIIDNTAVGDVGSLSDNLQAIQNTVTLLTGDMDLILIKLQLSDSADLDEVLGKIQELYNTKEYLEGCMEKISASLGYGSDVYLTIEQIVQKIEQFEEGYNKIAKELGFEFEENLTCNEKVEMIVESIADIHQKIADAEDQLLEIIASLEVGDADVSNLAESLIAVKNKITELKTELATKEAELKALNEELERLEATKEAESKALNDEIEKLEKKVSQKTTVMTVTEYVNSAPVSLGDVLNTCIYEKNGIYYANKGYEVSVAGNGEAWVESIAPVKNGGYYVIYLRDTSTGDVQMILISRVDGSKSDVGLEAYSGNIVEVDNSINILTNTEEVSPTVEISNSYSAKLNQELEVNIEPTSNSTKISKVFYQLVQEDADLSTSWVESDSKKIVISDTDNSRLYVKTVTEDGSTEIKKTTGFSINTIGKYVYDIVDEGKYNYDLVLNTSDKVKQLYVDGKAVKSGHTISAQKSYEIVAELTDGTFKEANIRIDKLAPLIEGVEDGGVYTEKVKIRFGDISGVQALLNGKEILSATYISEPGDYKLIVSDYANNSRTINFSIK